MNRLSLTLNTTEIAGSPSIHVSDNYEDVFIDVIKWHTDLCLALLMAERTSYQDGEFTMIKYSFNNMTDNQTYEFEVFAKQVAVAMSHAVNCNLN